MPAQRERLADGVAGGFEQMRVQLLGEEFVAQALVDQDAVRGRARPAAFSMSTVASCVDPARAVRRPGSR